MIAGLLIENDSHEAFGEANVQFRQIKSGLPQPSVNDQGRSGSSISDTRSRLPHASSWLTMAGAGKPARIAVLPANVASPAGRVSDWRLRRHLAIGACAKDLPGPRDPDPLTSDARWSSQARCGLAAGALPPSIDALAGQPGRVPRGRAATHCGASRRAPGRIAHVAGQRGAVAGRRASVAATRGGNYWMERLQLSLGARADL